MTREEKLMKVYALLAEVSDVLIDRFFDAVSYTHLTLPTTSRV